MGWFQGKSHGLTLSLSGALIVLVQDQMIHIICKKEGTFLDRHKAGRRLLHVTIPDRLHEKEHMDSHMDTPNTREERKKEEAVDPTFLRVIAANMKVIVMN